MEAFGALSIDWPQERVFRWGDARYWERRIDHAIGLSGAVDCNHCITVAHQELSLALRTLLGPGGGANFHTWAVWGSRKAGSTIRREDVSWLRPAATLVGALVGAAGGGLVARRRMPSRLALGAATTSLAGRGYAQLLLSRAAARILEGNVTVLDDIGRQTGRFVAAFWEPGSRTEEHLYEFLSPLRAGSAEDGGQDLLRSAYTSYFWASREDDPDCRDEHMLLGNLCAILHEHRRLDPYIDGSLPRIFRRIVTRDLLDVRIGSEHLRIGADVPTSQELYPATLSSIEVPELKQFLEGPGGWDRTPDTPVGSGALDWTEIHDRMNFIVDLFRSRHHDPEVFASPYASAQRDSILAMDGQLASAAA